MNDKSEGYDEVLATKYGRRFLVPKEYLPAEMDVLAWNGEGVNLEIEARLRTFEDGSKFMEILQWKLI